MAIDPSLYPLIINGAISIALAGWLAWMDIGNLTNRLFAAILLVRGLNFVAATVRRLDGTPAELNEALLASVPYMHILTVAFLLLFLANYPHGRSWFGTSRAGPWAAMALTAGIAGWYLLDHTSYWGDPGASWVPLRDYGPVALITDIRYPVLGLGAMVLARDYFRNPHGSGGFSTFLMAAAFVINALFEGVVGLVRALVMAADYAPSLWTPGEWLIFGLPILTLPLALGALGYMVATIRFEKEDASLQEARRLLVYVVPIAVASAIFIQWPGVAERWLYAYAFVSGFWRLLVPFLITYGLLRYSLFAMDVRIKAGVRRAILLGMFAVTFIVVTEAAESILAEGRGGWFGVLSASLLAMASKPVQSIAKRAADTVMPDTRNLSSMTRPERSAMFVDQFQLVQQDGNVTAKERKMLNRLAAALGLSESEARRLESGRTIELDSEAPFAEPKAPERGALRSLAAGAITAIVFGAISAIMEAAAPISSSTAGLVTAGLIAFMLGPIEAFADRLTRREPRGQDPHHVELYVDEVREALSDGDLSRRDRIYLRGLAERLGFGRLTRWRLDASVGSSMGVKVGLIRRMMAARTSA